MQLERLPEARKQLEATRLVDVGQRLKEIVCPTCQKREERFGQACRGTRLQVHCQALWLTLADCCLLSKQKCFLQPAVAQQAAQF